MTMHQHGSVRERVGVAGARVTGWVTTVVRRHMTVSQAGDHQVATSHLSSHLSSGSCLLSYHHHSVPNR